MHAFSPGSYSGVAPVNKYTNFFCYGNYEEKRKCWEKDNLPDKADKGHNDQGHFADRDGDQGKAGAYHTDLSDCPFKDTRKWRTETKE